MKTRIHLYPQRFCLPLVALGAFQSGLAGELLFSLAAAPDHSQLGSGFALAGDLDGDGIPDIAIAAKSSRVLSFFGSGSVFVVSGANGQPLRTYIGVPASSLGFGSSMCQIHADGDRIPDLAIGSPGLADASGFGAGAVWIYSGAHGGILCKIPGPSRSQFGVSVANAGDQDGDGLEDLYVGAPNAGLGTVFVISAADGRTLRSISTNVPATSFGIALAAMNDVDGDGRADVAVSAPGFRSIDGNQVGRVVLIRSSDNATVGSASGSAVFNRLGDSIAPARDANGDGYADLLVGSYSGGTALLLSGTDLDVIEDLSIGDLPQYSPVTVGGSLDYDSDGKADWLLGSSALNPGRTPGLGGIRVVSGVDRSILFEFHTDTLYSGLGLSLAVLEGLGMAAGETTMRHPAHNGTGLAHVWRVEELRDRDGDGVIDEEDAVPDSIMDPTVVILGVDSGVPNRISVDGVTLADRYAMTGSVSDYRNSALYAAELRRLGTDLLRAGLVNHNELRILTAAINLGTQPPGRKR